MSEHEKYAWASLAASLLVWAFFAMRMTEGGEVLDLPARHMLSTYVSTAALMVVELASPVSGKIVQVNPALDTTPEVINQSPYQDGWLGVMEATNWGVERQKLLDAPAYFQVM